MEVKRMRETQRSKEIEGERQMERGGVQRVRKTDIKNKIEREVKRVKKTQKSRD